MAQIKHLIYPERYAGDVELATAIRELQDIQIARSDAAPDQIGPQAAPTPDPDTMSRLYLELSQVVGGVAKTRKEIVLSYALLQCAMYFRDSDPPLGRETRWAWFRKLCFAALDKPTVLDIDRINADYYRIAPILDPPLPHPDT